MWNVSGPVDVNRVAAYIPAFSRRTARRNILLREDEPTTLRMLGRVKKFTDFNSNNLISCCVAMTEESEISTSNGLCARKKNGEDCWSHSPQFLP